jgi:sodium-dependent dicarboxylate transporter 2/3/5
MHASVAAGAVHARRAIAWHTGGVIEPAHASESPQGLPWHGRIGLLAGPMSALLLTAIVHPAVGARGGLSADASLTLGLLAWMAIWWMLEAVPLAVTALLPVILLPLAGVGSFRDSACHYADSVIFLFAGGGVMALALERHGLTERFTRSLLVVAGGSPVRVVAAIFVGTAALSAFMSNAAVTSMMIPIVTGLAASVRARAGAGPREAARCAANFATITMLCVAYASTVGGTATVIGSPPNAIAAKWLTENGHPVDFLRWASFATPLACVMALTSVLVLLRIFPVRGIECEPAVGRIGGLRAPAWIAMGIFVMAVVCWIVPSQWKPAALSDGIVAASAAVLLMTIPSSSRTWSPCLPWTETQRLPWGVYVLFGGGLSLADAMQRTALSQAIGDSFAGLGGAHALLALGAVVAVMVFASEIASNTALTATAVPIVGALAPVLGVSPERLVMATALGASLAFMLPVGTPPNAMVYATGRVSQRQMIRAGFLLDLSSILIITLLAHAWL